MQGARQKNSDLCLVGEKVVLVPYTKEHVPTYNAWMKSEYIRGLFGISRLFAIYRNITSNRNDCIRRIDPRGRA